MPKKTASPTLPPLSVEKLDELEFEEKVLRKKLNSCVYGDSYNYDALKASEYLRAFAIRIFDSYHEYFVKAPGYSLEWTEKLRADTTYRVMGCFVNVCSAQDYVLKSYALEVDNTIDDHIRSIVETANAELERKLLLPPSAYAASGVDIASGSPLMVMAATAGRRAHLQPSNVQSGKRIGRSIHSEKAAQRMEAYIQDKGITQTQFSVAVNADTKTLYRFRRTGKVEKSVAKRIAEAMGMTLEQFTS